MRDGAEILEALDTASKGVQKASVELSQLISDFGEAKVDDNGELHQGVKLRYEIAIQEELAYIYTSALEEGRKPPAEDIRSALAERAVRAKQPQLYADYNALRTRIEALKLWISNQKAVISANQSIRRAEAS